MPNQDRIMKSPLRDRGGDKSEYADRHMGKRGEGEGLEREGEHATKGSAIPASYLWAWRLTR